MAIKQCLQALAHYINTQRAAELQDNGFVVGAGSFAVDLCQGPELLLLVGHWYKLRRSWRDRLLAASSGLFREKAAFAQLLYAFANGANYKLDVFGGMRGREEAVTAFPDVNAFFDEVIEEQLKIAARHETEQ